MIPVRAKGYAVSVLAIIFEAGSFPPAAFLMMLNRPSTDHLSILPAWSLKKGCNYMD